MYDQVRTATLTERKPIFISEKFVILKNDNDEETVVNRKDCEFYTNIPCEGCGTGCYNYQMGDCKNFQWIKHKQY